MKKIGVNRVYVYLLSVTTLCLLTILSFAQDSSSSSSKTAQTTTTTQSAATVQPWMWIVGAIVLLLIVIALVRGNKGKDGSHTDKITYTKTTSSTDDV